LSRQAPPCCLETDALRVAAIGGTASQAAKMIQGKKEPTTLQLAVISRAELKLLLDQIAPLTMDELRKWPKLSASRAPIIYAGVSILLAVLEHFDVSSYILVDKGLRYGLLHLPSRRLLPQSAHPGRRAAAPFCLACGGCRCHRDRSPRRCNCPLHTTLAAGRAALG
jgi:exopolyphosphatase/pppGpp-phosphohydrolase